MVGGLAKTEYKVDGAAAWTTGTSVVVDAAADHSNDGAHAISYRSTDAAGNVETTKSCAVKISTPSARRSPPPAPPPAPGTAPTGRSP